MRVLILAALACGSLCACQPINTSYDNLQVNTKTLPFPANYVSEAQAAVADRPKLGPLQISEPQNIPAESIISPERWYVCILGIDPGVAKPASDSSVLALVRDRFIPSPITKDRYELILIFGSKRPSMAPIATFGSPLCAGAVYHQGT